MDAKTLRNLRTRWERRLEREGLGDIEKGGALRVYHSHRLYHSEHNDWWHPSKNEAKEAYFELAGQFLHSYAFESKTERMIWELHSQGMPVRKIAARIGQPKNWSNINKKLLRLRRLMLGSSA